MNVIDGGITRSIRCLRSFHMHHSGIMPPNESQSYINSVNQIVSFLKQNHFEFIVISLCGGYNSSLSEQDKKKVMKQTIKLLKPYLVPVSSVNTPLHTLQINNQRIFLIVSGMTPNSTQKSYCFKYTDAVNHIYDSRQSVAYIDPKPEIPTNMWGPAQLLKWIGVHVYKIFADPESVGLISSENRINYAMTNAEEKLSDKRKRVFNQADIVISSPFIVDTAEVLMSKLIDRLKKWSLGSKSNNMNIFSVDYFNCNNGAFLKTVIDLNKTRKGTTYNLNHRK